jgi:AcrR family transcriptional regulator
VTDSAAAEAGAGPPERGARASWRDRSVERSLRSARAKAESRSDSFVRAAAEILQSTGRTDFTVQQIVDRSSTSLRSFYQHFASKDELLLAVFEEVVWSATERWRAEIGEITDPLNALRQLLGRTFGLTGSPQGPAISKAFTAFQRQWSESKPEEFARILSPLHDLLTDIVTAGADQGVFRRDIDPATLALLMMQTLIAEGQTFALGVHLGDQGLTTESLYRYFTHGLVGPAAPA